MLLYAQLAIVAVLAVLSITLGINGSLYLTLWWWDLPAHFLGGVWAGFFGSWVMRESGMQISLVSCILFALGIGVAWEILEYAGGIAGNIFMDHRLDTIKDLIVDMLGGAAAGYVITRLKL